MLMPAMNRGLAFLKTKCQEEIKQNMHNLAGSSEIIWQSAKQCPESTWKELNNTSQESLPLFEATNPKSQSPPL